MVVVALVLVTGRSACQCHFFSSIVTMSGVQEKPLQVHASHTSQ